MQNQAKVLLRKNIKKLVQQMSAESKALQSNAVMQKVITQWMCFWSYQFEF